MVEIWVTINYKIHFTIITTLSRNLRSIGSQCPFFLQVQNNNNSRMSGRPKG